MDIALISQSPPCLFSLYVDNEVWVELKVGVEVDEDEYVDTERKIYLKKRK